MNLFEWLWWGKDAVSDIQRDTTAMNLKLDQLQKDVNNMGAREDAAYARQEELIALVKEGSAAKDAKIAALEAELANADADAQARVDAALEADSEFDADKVEAGNAALEELVATPPPPVEPEQ